VTTIFTRQPPVREENYSIITATQLMTKPLVVVGAVEASKQVGFEAL
jgi:hypothetical protein